MYCKTACEMGDCLFNYVYVCDRIMIIRECVLIVFTFVITVCDGVVNVVGRVSTVCDTVVNV